MNAWAGHLSAYVLTWAVTAAPRLLPPALRACAKICSGPSVHVCLAKAEKSPMGKNETTRQAQPGRMRPKSYRRSYMGVQIRFSCALWLAVLSFGPLIGCDSAVTTSNDGGGGDHQVGNGTCG